MFHLLDKWNIGTSSPWFQGVDSADPSADLRTARGEKEAGVLILLFLSNCNSFTTGGIATGNHYCEFDSGRVGE